MVDCFICCIVKKVTTIDDYIFYYYIFGAIIFTRGMIGNVTFYSNFIILARNRLAKECHYTLKGKVTERDYRNDALAGLSEHDLQQFQNKNEH